MQMNCHKLIEVIEKYSFNKQNIQQLISSEYFEQNIKPKSKQIKKNDKIVNNDFYIPEESDSIFWCWIIFKLGFSEYEMLKETKFIIS